MKRVFSLFGFLFSLLATDPPQKCFDSSASPDPLEDLRLIIEEMKKAEDLGSLVSAKKSFLSESATIKEIINQLEEEASMTFDRKLSLMDGDEVPKIEQKLSPAFQWAQNDSHIYLQVKFAVRWSSPGAVWVESETRVNEVKENRIFVSASGVDSRGVEKNFELDLLLFDSVVPDSATWSSSSVGKLTLTVKKTEDAQWKRLLATESRTPNMHYWFDMVTESDEIKEKEIEKQRRTPPRPRKIKLSHEKISKKGKNFSVFNAANRVSKRAAKALPGLGLKSFVLLVIFVLMSLLNKMELAMEDEVKEVAVEQLEESKDVKKQKNTLKAKRRLAGRN